MIGTLRVNRCLSSECKKLFEMASCANSFNSNKPLHFRFFLFEEDSREVTFITSSNFHDHCVLKVQHVIHRSEHSVSVVILSAATDGRVVFWNVTDLCNFVVHTHITREKDEEDDVSKVNVYLEKRHQSQHAVNPDKIVNSSKFGETHHGMEDSTVTEEGLKLLKLVPADSLTCHQSGINALHFEHFDGKKRNTFPTHINLNMFVSK